MAITALLLVKKRVPLSSIAGRRAFLKLGGDPL